MDEQNAERPQPLHPYKPGRRFQYLPVIMIHADHTGYWREETDTEGTDFRDLLTVSKSLIVVENSAKWAITTETACSDHPAFDYGCRVFETRVLAPDLTKDDEELGPDFEQVFTQEICFEWGQRPKYRDRINANWHSVLDPSMFYGDSIGDLTDNIAMYRFACEFRQWCMNRNIPISLTKGSAAGRILRGLVREPQCKVPYATNTNARKALGANMTRANTHGRIHPDITEFDQRAAQHLVARDTPMPDRDTFTAQGDYVEQKMVCFEPGDDAFTRLTTQNERGVILATVELWTEALYRKKHPWSPYMPWNDEPVWLTTNELSLVKRCGVKITGIICAWTSPGRSIELSVHARTALAELERADDFTKEWLKPVNLAVYGGVAATAHPAIRRTYREGDTRRSTTERMTNHVAWLAMIQREVRKRSVHFAMDLEEQGITVVGIYVDAVFAKVGNHDLERFIPRYFVDKGTGMFGGSGAIKVVGDVVSFPGMPLSDPNRKAKAEAYIAAHATTDETHPANL